MKRDYFSEKANGYDGNEKRVDNVGNIARAIIASTRLDPAMALMDFGSGTGLLLERIAPLVKKITAVDVSPAMNEQLSNKQASLQCELEMLSVDLTVDTLARTFDGIISSMTLHHIRDIDALFARFFELLNEGGFIALSDLDLEDGSFHTEDTGVHHFGFDREALAAKARAAGFRNVEVLDASTVEKPQGEYSVFLLRAEK